MRIPLLRPCLLALACTAVVPAQARKGPLPYHAVVEVSAAPKVGEAALREEAAAAVSGSLRGKGCLLSVEPPGGKAADLRVAVRFEELTSETIFDSSLAQTISPHAPPDVRESRTARLRATMVVELTELPRETPFLQRRLTVDVRRSPRTLGEDAEAAARQEALDQIGERVALVVCKAKAPAR